ncbi:MAG: DUF1553 domain-containing protein [Gemmataceae bacterium]|nr:DUF1553 domain-containing protein [Gemmataceae bacterium]MDW8265003.1 DUF1553 domain-containing protein [Gemmataceae bacterium]
MSGRILTLSAVLFATAASTAPASPSLVILPGHVTLSGPEARQRLLVQRLVQGELAGQVREGLVFGTSDPQVARVENGVVVPVGNGRTVVTAVIDGLAAQATVEVVDMDKPWQWSFRNHVLPVLSRAGCNSGACHGALAGKGGFRLSLRGYDPDADHHSITRQARGRRIELSDPGRSLLLAKPTGAIPHKGGRRFDVGSLEYRILAEWISRGAPAPEADSPRLKRLEVLPPTAIVAKGESQQLVVRAFYTDGRVEDVTRWAKFTSADESVATVDEHGRVRIIGHGEGAITAWFSSQIVTARVTSPYPNKVPPAVFATAERRNFIDELVLRKLQRLNLPPSPPASDAEFLRRAYLDTIGVLPKADEVRAFLADPRPEKRDRLVDALLARPEFVDYWAYKWSDLLLVNGQKLRPASVKSYYLWIRRHVEDNTPWDRFVREILTAQGNSLENGAVNFYSLHQDPETLTENVCQAFLGLSINCAKCHNHPLEKWTNNQYYAMANLFSRVRAKGWGGDARNGDGSRTIYVTDEGELIQPLTGKPQPPTPLDGQPLPFDWTEDRRVALADWLTSPQNPYFSRAIANRIWANFFGVGLVEPVDDLRDSNPASNEELLQAAARFLADNRFDLKALMRAILQSQTYQRSSQPLPENRDEKRYYSRYYPRRLMAEVLLDAISQVTDVPTPFTEIAFPGADRVKTDFYPKGTRALQLYDSAVVSPFLRTFGRNPRQITCECERSQEPSMVQVLHLSNGDTINQKLSSKECRIGRLVAQNVPDEDVIEEAYLSALSRFPTPEEKARLLEEFRRAPPAERRAVIEDLYWGILTSREFLFQH